MEGGKTRIYKQNLSRLIRLPDFFGITDSSGLMPLSQIRDNGIINNGKAPGKDESKDRKPSVIEQLKNQPYQSRKKSTPKKNKEKEL